ncbi:MAG: tRNA (N6-isopentenyl adenosine(37)-C2)-methylthiotransferase MiaB [Clostridia bacterium]|nr:tRNA (N6-isopentenyl adenosine(37)-C2)-methylthiotransferase MiaB [Clostridia bacterium]
MTNAANVQNEIIDILRQQKLASSVRKLIDERARLRGREFTACVITYGCQQNENDSERLRGMLSGMGYTNVSDRRGADLVVFNTCAVREGAEMRLFGNVGALVHDKRKNPDMKIAVCGCMMQIEENARKIKMRYPHVDIVFGTHTLARFPEILYNALSDDKRAFDVIDTAGHVYEGLPIMRDRSFSANISIMYGCNNFCSYCIVPFVRGRERSRRPENIYAEIRGAIKSGAREIMLLGQNVNSYGRDLGGDIDFSDLLRSINDIEGDFRIKFMTSHPKDASEKLFLTMAECGKVARHLHLPFQAGDDRVLTAMNRGYTREQYLNKLARARELMPDLTVTSDVIVGFPSETEDEFLNTLKLVREGQFDMLFTFLYSRRPGTPAAAMANQVPREEKKRRFDMLTELQNEISLKKNQALLGRRLRVLAEGKSRTDPSMMTGRTDGGKTVNFEGAKELTGEFCDLEIIKANTWSLYGKL